MKFTCAKNELKDALQVVNRAVAVKPQTPILAGIYMKAEGSTLEMQANNFSLGIITKIPANTEVPGNIVIVGKYLLEVVAKLPGETVTISREEDDAVVKIQSGSASFDLLAMNAEDFPTVKSQEVMTSFKIRPAVLKKLIRRTVFACAGDEARPIFAGCFFDINGNSITVAATNTHRIAIMKDTIAEEMEQLSFIVPATTLRDLVRMIDASDSNDFVTVDYSGKYIAFTFGNIFMTSRLIEGQYPPYQKVVPASTAINVKINVAKMLEVVDRIALISKETEYNTIRFIFRQGGVEISSTSPDVGKAVEHVEATVEGEDLDISFNVKYITEVLNVLETEYCRIGLNKPLYPIDVREDDNDDYIYIVTPVRTSN